MIMTTVIQNTYWVLYTSGPNTVGTDCFHSNDRETT